MIFVTVGTEQFSFDRLIRAADLVAEEFKPEAVFVQVGHGVSLPTRCQWVRFFAFDQLVEQIIRARVVISHAGVGSLLTCLRLGKVPILMPRRQHLGEHVDDHQVELATRMAQIGYALLAERSEELAPLIREYEERQARMRIHASSEPPLATALSKYLDTIEPRFTR